MSTEKAHPNDGTWDNHTPGIWYGEVIIERPNGETDYVYAYSNTADDVPDVRLLVPHGCKYLEHSLYLTSHGKWELREDSWAFDAQEGPDTQSYDDYWLNGCNPSV